MNSMKALNRTGFPMKLTFLGTSSAKPTRYRNVSSTLLQIRNEIWMFDCGEGTQHQLQRLIGKTSSLNKIFITHLHGDHMFGLPGMLCHLCESNRDREITIYGPEGIGSVIQAIKKRNLAVLPNYRVVEFVKGDPKKNSEICVKNTGTTVIHEDDSVIVEIGSIKHSVQSYGFVITQKERPHIDVESLQKYYPPSPLYRDITNERIKILPNGMIAEQFLIRSPPKKIVLLGDTYNPYNIIDAAIGCNILVHESTFPDLLRSEALEKSHSTSKMAGKFASDIGAEHLILTHFSAKLGTGQIKELVLEAQSIYNGHITAAIDFLSVDTNHQVSYSNHQKHITEPIDM